MDVKRKIRTKIMPFLLKKFWYVNESEKAQHEEIFDSADFVRFSQIEKLITSEELPEGNFVELGVYRGRLTRLLARVAACKNNKLFLFDTFEGFDERSKKFENENWVREFEDFSNTSEDMIRKICLSKGMKERNIRIKKGYFPVETMDTEVITKTYSFVSIDFDLYKPTKDALNLFFPLLAEGGFVVVHDYGNAKYKGVKVAVDEFIGSYGIKSYFELCDYCGSLIIKKC